MADEGRTMSRRRLLQGGMAAGASLLLPVVPATHAATSVIEEFDGPGDGWGDRWRIDGVANLRVEQGRGLLEAATDIYPADARAVAFLVDQRIADGAVTATMTATGRAGGVILRRTGPRAGYLALYGADSGLLQIIARTPAGESVLASRVAPLLQGPMTVTLQAAGQAPTRLVASVRGADRTQASIEATDATEQLQQAGDPGLVATAETGFASGPDTPPIVASARAVFVTDAGDDVEAGPVGGLKDEVYRQVSTAVYERVAVTSDELARVTAPAVVAAVTGPPHGSGARVSVVSDVPARVDLEVATRPDLRDARVVPGGDTNAFRTLLGTVPARRGTREVFWRPILRREGQRTDGPIRRFRALPRVGDGSDVTVVVGGCGTEFKGVDGSVFDLITELDPDVFAWIGDLNYPDSHGSLAQTMSGYEGIWQQFLAAPPLTHVFERAAFAPQRDDHDYGRNDLSADAIPQHGRDPWEHIMAPEPYYAFEGGLVAAYVLDDRRYKDPDDLPDTPDKSLLGRHQREWLFEGLASSSAPFKLVLSPNPVWLPTNNETCWGRAYTAERQLLVDHIAGNVDGTVLFVTADSHAAAVVERDGLVEMRPCPIELPAPPGWHDAASGEGVVFSEQGESYVAHLRVLEEDGVPTMHAALLRGNGSLAWERTFTQGRDGGPGRSDSVRRDSGSDTSRSAALPATGAGAAGVGAALLGGAAAVAGRDGPGSGPEHR